MYSQRNKQRNLLMSLGITVLGYQIYKFLSKPKKDDNDYGNDPENLDSEVTEEQKKEGRKMSDLEISQISSVLKSEFNAFNTDEDLVIKQLCMFTTDADLKRLMSVFGTLRVPFTTQGYNLFQWINKDLDKNEKNKINLCWASYGMNSNIPN